MVKFLGLIDIFATIIIVVVSYDMGIAQGLVIAITVYLLLKALLFLKDIGSLIDFACGVLLILSIFTVLPQMVFFVFAGFLGLKGLMSLFA